MRRLYAAQKHAEDGFGKALLKIQGDSLSPIFTLLIHEPFITSGLWPRFLRVRER